MAQGYDYKRTRNAVFSYGGRPPFSQARVPAAGPLTDAYKDSRPSSYGLPIGNQVVTRVDDVVIAALPTESRLPSRNSESRSNPAHYVEYQSSSPEKFVTPRSYPDDQRTSRPNSSAKRSYKDPPVDGHHVSSSSPMKDQSKAENFATKLQDEALKAILIAEVLGSSTGGGGNAKNYEYNDNGFDYTSPPSRLGGHHDPQKVKELIHKVGNWRTNTNTNGRQHEEYGHSSPDYLSNIIDNGGIKQGVMYNGQPPKQYISGYDAISPTRSNVTMGSRRSGGIYGINSTEAAQKYNGAFIY